MLKLLVLFLSTIFVFNSYAVGGAGIRMGNGMVRVTPLVTYEQVQKNYPTPHTKNVLSYGVGVEIGPPIFNVDLRGSQSDDTSDYTDEEVKETTQKLSVGLQSSYALNSVFRFFLRGGAQGKKTKQKITNKTTLVTTTSESAFYVDPYVGTGIRISASNIFSMSLGVNAIFSDYPNKGKVEYQTTLAIGVGF